MIHGERVTLRPLDLDEDVELCYQWINDPEITQYLRILGPITRIREREMLQGRDLLGEGKDLMLAVDADDGTYIGNCGLHEIDRRARKAELGVMIGDKSYWSRGYGRDIVTTLCAFGFVDMNLQRIALGVYSHNPRAQACYEACGFQHEGRLRRAVYCVGEYRDEIRMAILREEFMERYPERVPEEMVTE